MSTNNSLDLFDPITARWFSNSIGTPTAVQEEAWPSIAAGKDTLVSAPTGTGKTLSAFLVFIDRLKKQAREGTLKEELQLIYVSPLKALASDIRENLRRPLDGILAEELKESNSFRDSYSDVTIGIRTGDTPQNVRRRMIKSPPHILITTPESLYLMLTSMSGQSILCTAKAIIIDELHAIIDSKRGAHLMLSIARLDKLCQRPLQRIGLSATINPIEKAAEYLSPEPVTIAAPRMEKKVEIQVTSPLPEGQGVVKDSIWAEIATMVYDYCQQSHSVIAFVEGRTYAEKLAYYVNQLGGEGFARTHHGSLSKEQRFEVESALRNGELRLLCATSSMELGIDVGEIDQVFQIGCPRSISSTMQRLGRAGHNPDRVSVMHMFPRTAVEGLYCGLTAKVAREGGVEYFHPPRLCLDVLSQHLVSMANGKGYDVDEVMDLLPRAYPFKDVTKEDVEDLLCMLSGDYEHIRDIPVRPRILYDRIHNRVEGDPYSRMLAISAGGTIPDKGLYTVRTENGVKLGELDEEFVYESRIGDKFLLGTFVWKIISQQKDTVIVTQSNAESARLPFWKGEIKGRGLQTGIAFGKIFRNLTKVYNQGTLLETLGELGLDESASIQAKDFIKRQIEATKILPDDQTLLIEHFCDKNGDYQMMVHSVFGRKVNAPLSLLVQEVAKRKTYLNIGCVDEEDGFLLYSYDGTILPEGLLYGVDPDSARSILEALLPATPLFNMTFRYNCGRALMMGVRKNGRQPLWVQRMRSADMMDSLMRYKNHPLIRETRRECLEDYWDLSGVEYILKGIQSGNLEVREMYLESPSPMSLPLQWQVEADMMYNYAPTTLAIQNNVVESLKESQMITPEPELLERVSMRQNMPEDEKQLHSLLMIEGDLVAGELDIPIEWLEILSSNKQVKYIEPGLWIAAEHEEEYHLACLEEDQEARLHIIRRALRYRGVQSLEQIMERYVFSEKVALELLTILCNTNSAVEKDGFYYHAKLYDRARNETLKSRRARAKTNPAEKYASLLISHINMAASPSDQLEKTIGLFCNQPIPIKLWESVIFPLRVRGYATSMLDVLLTQGEFFWHLNSKEELSFRRYDDINWDFDLIEISNNLDGDERIIYEALLKRGASFIKGLSSLIEGNQTQDVLLSLAQKGLVNADSFVPIRQLLNQEKVKKSTTRQRVNARVMALTGGRWEITRPLIEPSLEKQIDKVFDRVIVLCRETAENLPWAAALEILRVWEYTGQVRRGYFIEGLSGAQFIREKDYANTMLTLEKTDDQIIWLSSVDPIQPWGKSLTHKENRSFMNVPGTIVALKEGLPIAVLERQGKVLRVFDYGTLEEALKEFVQEFNKKRILATLNRVVVKEYPTEVMNELTSVGFIKEIQDFVLYRK